jgi:hypothetical protein
VWQRRLRIGGGAEQRGIVASVKTAALHRWRARGRRSRHGCNGLQLRYIVPIALRLGHLMLLMRLAKSGHVGRVIEWLQLL